MAFKFETLDIWNRGLELSNKIDRLAKTFPRTEIFSLSSQIKRAADSVCLNIAEGCTGLSDKEFIRFLSISLRSALEVVSCLFLAVRRNYISEEEFRTIYHEYEVLCKMISALRNTLKKSISQNTDRI